MQNCTIDQRALFASFSSTRGPDRSHCPCNVSSSTPMQRKWKMLLSQPMLLRPKCLHMVVYYCTVMVFGCAQILHAPTQFSIWIAPLFSVSVLLSYITLRACRPTELHYFIQPQFQAWITQRLEVSSSPTFLSVYGLT